MQAQVDVALLLNHITATADTVKPPDEQPLHLRVLLELLAGLEGLEGLILRVVLLVDLVGIAGSDRDGEPRLRSEATTVRGGAFVVCRPRVGKWQLIFRGGSIPRGRVAGQD